MAGLGVALCCMVALEYYAVEGRFRASQCQAGCPLSPPCMADCWFFLVLFCFVFVFLFFLFLSTGMGANKASGRDICMIVSHLFVFSNLLS